jgi:uncharacterized membrane protein YfcA
MLLFGDFQWWTYLALFGAGLVSGAISPTFGIGGGLLNVPILLLGFSSLLGSNPGNTATVTSLGVIIFTSLSGTISYIREKRIDYSIALRFIIFATPGAISGGIFSNWLKEQEVDIDLFQIIFAVTMITIALYKIFTIFWGMYKKRINNQKNGNNESIETNEEENIPNWRKTTFYRDFQDKRGVHFKYKAKLMPGIFIAILGGFVGATLGLGGGVIYVPVLTMAMGIPAGIATAISTLTIFISIPIATGIRSINDTIRWDIVFIMAAGTVITANIVPRFLHKIKSEWILTGFWILVIAAAIRILIKVLTGAAI